MYWVYDLSNLHMAIAIVAAFVVYGSAGLLCVYRFRRHQLGNDFSDNDVVGLYFGSMVGFYGIMLGLVAVSAWQSLSDAEKMATTESAAIERLYRNISAYPKPMRGALQVALIDYTQNVIEVAWPMQRSGRTPTGGSEAMTMLQNRMFPYEPKTLGQLAVHQEALNQYGHLSELRRLRVFSASGGIPGTMWWVVLLGALTSIAMAWFFKMTSLWYHLALTTVYSFSIGLLIFLIVALDNPYLGEFSVGPDAYQLVLDRIRMIK